MSSEENELIEIKLDQNYDEIKNVHNYETEPEIFK